MKFLNSHKASALRGKLIFSALAALYANATLAAGPGDYSIINLGPDAGLTVLNKQGQVAFSTWSPDGIYNGFFDGRRVHVLGSLGGGYTALRGMNEQGVVVGQSQDAALGYHAFTWTAAGGMRALPGPGATDANAINGRRQVVGMVGTPAGYARANRWNADGTLTSLGPLPARISTAWAINDSGVSVGDSEVALYDSRAMVWDAAGKATDLGTFGGSQSTAKHINAAGQVLGTYYKDQRGIGFLWSPGSGAVRIGPDSGDQYVTALNDNGEVTGNNVIVDGNPGYRYRPFIWSAQRGMRLLPVAGALDARVNALNRLREMVGSVTRSPDDPRSRRATYWKDATGPVDLNKRLYKAPAGLVLYAATAINDDGAIVAESNAGLVLLRPGRVGTPAPVLGPIAGGAADDTVRLNAAVDLTVAFVDSDAAESHAASSSVNDGCPQAAPSLRERLGAGDVSLRHTFCQAGTFTVRVKVTDRAGNASQVQRRLVVN